jgi:hypothetical protein
MTMMTTRMKGTRGGGRAAAAGVLRRWIPNASGKSRPRADAHLMADEEGTGMTTMMIGMNARDGEDIAPMKTMTTMSLRTADAEVRGGDLRRWSRKSSVKSRGAAVRLRMAAVVSRIGTMMTMITIVRPAVVAAPDADLRRWIRTNSGRLLPKADGRLTAVEGGRRDGIMMKMTNARVVGAINGITSNHR